MKYKTADDRLVRVGEAYEYWKNKADTVTKFNQAKMLRNMLDEVPSAQPEMTKGHWIIDENRFGNKDRHCSQCGAILEGDDYKWRNNYYCYHCGSRMEVEIE